MKRAIAMPDKNKTNRGLTAVEAYALMNEKEVVIVDVRTKSKYSDNKWNP